MLDIGVIGLLLVFGFLIFSYFLIIFSSVLFYVFQDGCLIKNCTDTPCSLKLFNMTKTDSGVYVCRVSTMRGSYTNFLKIIVGFVPYFKGEVKNNIRFEENGDVTLDCSAYGEPAPMVIFYTYLHSANSFCMIETLTYVFLCICL